MSWERNKSIIVHGYRGISRKDIEDIVPLEELWKQLMNVFESLGVPMAKQSSLFAEVKHFLKQELSQAEKRLETLTCLYPAPGQADLLA